MTKSVLKTLDDTRWVLYDIIGPIGTGTNEFELNFTAGGTKYTRIRFEDTAVGGTLYFDDTVVVNYPTCAWESTQVKTLEIDGGLDAVNPQLLSWFAQYGKNISPNDGDVSIVDALKTIATAIETSAQSDLPDATNASVGDVLSLDQDKNPMWTASGLPPVTSLDNGKFACVVNGAWAAVTIPMANEGDF